MLSSRRAEPTLIEVAWNKEDPAPYEVSYTHRMTALTCREISNAIAC